jgi:hypothetical protein
MMRGRHTTAILEMMEVRDDAQTIDEYVSIAVLLGRDPAKRSELSARIASRKHRVHRDRQCIVAPRGVFGRRRAQQWRETARGVIALIFRRAT